MVVHQLQEEMPAFAWSETQSSFLVEDVSTMLMATFGCGKSKQTNGLNYPRVNRQSHGLMYLSSDIEKKRRNIGASWKVKHPLPLRRNQKDYKVAKRCDGLHHRQEKMDQDPFKHKWTLRSLANPQRFDIVSNHPRRKAQTRKGEIPNKRYFQTRHTVSEPIR